MTFMVKDVRVFGRNVYVDKGEERVVSAGGGSGMRRCQRKG
jgi:hypothetical protein